jgi:hypothetical protein
VSAPTAREGWRDAGALAALAVAVLVICWPLGLTNRILAGIDAFTYFTPYWSYRMAAFREGAIPLWNPYLFSGAPFLANIQAAVLYPLHWPLSWLDAPRALVWSALLHLWFAAAFTYALARRSFRASRLAAFAAALIFGLGGFSLARIENINQLNALAWLPALLLLYDEAVDGRRRLAAFAGLAFVIALQLLAGHTQTTFINMVGLGLWALATAGRPFTRPWLVRLLPLLAVAPALALSAAQLLPTLELNGLGLRTGGLDFRSAASFSLRPRLLAQSLLPPFFSDLSQAFGSEGYAEFVGYAGVVGLALALAGALAAWRDRRGTGWHALGPLVLVTAGGLLALGAYNPLYYVLWRIVPGFDLFRAPARWLELLAMGVALLAALGIDALPGLKRSLRVWLAAGTARVGLVFAAVAFLALLAIQQLPARATLLAWALALAVTVALVYRMPEKPDRSWRPVRSGLVALLFVELALAARTLPFTAATAPMVTGLRNATAALLAASGDASPPARDRFLSLSDIRYDPGDLAELRALQAHRLPSPAVERLVRAAKQVEVLAPNLPLLFRLPAVDGYDGGLLPLHRYVLLQRLFLDEEKMTPDGRLAEQLDEIPPDRLLDLTGVRYAITDKQRDLWAGDVYYDLEQSTTVLPGAGVELHLGAQPAFAADALGIVAGADADGQIAAASIMLTAEDGEGFELALPPTRALADPPQPVVLALPGRAALASVTVTNTGSSPLILRGISLIDRSTGAHQSVTVSPRNNFRRIHSGDVKIYERIDAPGRAWVTHGAILAGDEEAALAALAEPTFDPRASTVLEAVAAAALPAPQTPTEAVTTLRYAPEQIVYAATLDTSGWLVMADAWYPGWNVTIDGEPAELLRANLLYRAIALSPGRHVVTLTYEPQAWRTGLVISLAALGALLAALVAGLFGPRFTRLPRKTL